MKVVVLALWCAVLMRGETVRQADLNKWLLAWQNKQHLQEWRIGIGFATERMLKGPEGGDAVGDVHFPAAGEARIRILDPAETIRYAPPSKLRLYTELTVVHELVHVSLYWLSRYDGSRTRQADDAENEVVEDIAEALLFGRIPLCMTPLKFMEFEIDALPWKPLNAAYREQAASRLAAAFLSGRPSWWQRRYAGCADTIRRMFGRSEWR